MTDGWVLLPVIFLVLFLVVPCRSRFFSSIYRFFCFVLPGYRALPKPFNAALGKVCDHRVLEPPSALSATPRSRHPL